MDSDNKPQVANRDHFSSGELPRIIAFCERDEKTHVKHAEEESYEYKLNDQVVYVLKKKSGRFEIVEFDGNKILRVSAGDNLEDVLMRALAFSENDRDKQEKRTNILFPVKKVDAERVMAIMYYLGGYPRSFFPNSAEFQFVRDTFLDPEIDFLSYSYVPVNYIPWLREELKNAGFIGQDKNRTLWTYKK
jgi:hypothetical protein